MKLLALDTSHSACSLALMIDNEIYLSHHDAPMQQAKLVLPSLDALLQAHDITLKDLDALAFGCGPGSFTGVRIAASVMQGLAYATDLPLISISSLAATAQAAFDDLGWPNIMVGTDARIQEVYWGLYQANKNGLAELAGAEKVCPPQLINIPPGRDWYAVGNAWQEYAEAMLTKIAFTPPGIDTTRMPMANAVAKLAEAKFQKKEWVSLSDALPVYLRNNVASKGK
jgi:tRNA threonylcarbamoyladenosine biosynthesis protein TsaB